MNNKSLLIKTIFFGLFPVLIVFGHYLYSQDGGLFYFIENKNLVTVVFLLAIFIITINIFEKFRDLKKRKLMLVSPKLFEVDKQLKLPRRFGLLNKEVAIKDEAIEIKSKGEVILHLDKTKREIISKGLLGKSIIPFDDIEFLIYEYNQYQSYAPRLWIGIAVGNDNTVYKNYFSVKTNDGHEIKLFDATLKDSETEMHENYALTGSYDAKPYLVHGEKMIRLLSYHTDKEYLILDNQ